MNNINQAVLLSVEDYIPKGGGKIALTGFTAAAYWNFTNVMVGDIDLCVHKGYNYNFKTKHIKTTWKSKSRWHDGILKETYEGRTYNIYSPEKTLVEIIKSCKDSFNDVVLETIKMFFEKMNYQRDELMRFATQSNVKQYIIAFEGAYSK